MKKSHQKQAPAAAVGALSAGPEKWCPTRVSLSDYAEADTTRVEVEHAALLIKELQYRWESPDCTPVSVTQDTFTLLQLLSDNPYLQNRLPDDVLTQHFSSLMPVMHTSFDFNCLYKGAHDLMSMSASLGYTQLALWFFELQMRPYWSESEAVFFKNIYFIPPDAPPLSEMNKLRFLLLLSDLVYNQKMPEAVDSIAYKERLAGMQRDVIGIRRLVGQVISKISSSEDEWTYLSSEAQFFYKHHPLSNCPIYILWSCARLELLKRFLLVYFADKSSTFNAMTVLFGDNRPSVLNADIALALAERDALVRSLSRELLFKPETTEPETTERHPPESMPEMDRRSLESVMKEYIKHHDLRSLFNWQCTLMEKDTLVNEVMKDSSAGPSLLDQLFFIFAKKSIDSLASETPHYWLNQSKFAQQIVHQIFPKTEDQVKFFVREPVVNGSKQMALKCFITCHLISLSTLNGIYFIHGQRRPGIIHKTKIADNLLAFMDSTAQFSDSFHALFHVASQYAHISPDLEQLLKDLMLILDVLRERNQIFKDCCTALLANHGNRYPLESVERIRRIVDPILWDADQRALLAQSTAVEASLLAECEDGGSATPSGSNKKKKKKKAKPPVDAAPLSMAAGSVLSDLPAFMGDAISSVECGSTVPASDPALASRDSTSPKVDVDLKTAEACDQSMVYIDRLHAQLQPLSDALKIFQDNVHAYISRLPGDMMPAADDLKARLEQRLALKRYLRACFNSVRKQGLIEWTTLSFDTKVLVLPDCLIESIEQLNAPLQEMIAVIQGIKTDQKATLSIDRPRLEALLLSAMMRIIPLSTLRSYQYLPRFRERLQGIVTRFDPIFIRLLSNQGHHSLQDCVYEAKCFAQVIADVQHWSYMIHIAPLANFDGRGIPPINLPSARTPIELFNPRVALTQELLSLAQAWNSEVNQFSIALSQVLASEPDSTYKATITAFLDYLSHCYFKIKMYPGLQELRCLLKPFAKVELFGSGVFMNDVLCDLDVLVVSDSVTDNHPAVFSQIQSSVAQSEAFGPDVAKRMRSKHVTGDKGDVLNIHVPISPCIPVPLDLNVYVGEIHPLRHYFSHTAGILNVRTLRISCAHDSMRHVLLNQLSYKKPESKTMPEEADVSQLTHVLKMMIKGRSAGLSMSQNLLDIWTLIHDNRGNIAALDKSGAPWGSALAYLLKKHMAHCQIIGPFFHRTHLLLRFYQEMGFKILAQTERGVFEIIAIKDPSKELSLVCKQIPLSHASSLAAALSSDSFLVRLPDALLKHVNVIIEVPMSSGAFFPRESVAGSLKPVGAPPGLSRR